jgi:hypothetical protein
MNITAHFRQPEIHDLHLSGFRHHDVAGFDIAVDDAFGVRGFEAFGDLRGEVDDLRNR